jgi:hypothetical protein
MHPSRLGPPACAARRRCWPTWIGWPQRAAFSASFSRVSSTAVHPAGSVRWAWMGVLRPAYPADVRPLRKEILSIPFLCNLFSFSFSGYVLLVSFSFELGLVRASVDWCTSKALSVVLELIVFICNVKI